jgi:hypothetical protein
LGRVLLLVTLFFTDRIVFAAFTEEERNNISVYEKAADAVVNITSTAVQDIFLSCNPIFG